MEFSIKEELLLCTKVWEIKYLFFTQYVVFFEKSIEWTVAWKWEEDALVFSFW